MNVVIWARVSSREQREGYSIDAQLRACRTKAEREGWAVVREFAVAESAKRGAERLAFNEMYEWVRRNARKEAIGAVLAHKLDRVCRNMRDAVRMLELEDQAGVKLAFVDNQFGPGAAGTLSFNVMAAVAQYYSDNLRSEVLKGKDEKVRQGWFPGGAPFGYVNADDRNEPIHLHPQRAETVVRIFELYARGDTTFELLAERLHEEGHVFRPSQPKFNRTALSYILNNRFYLGEINWHGETCPGKHRPLISHALFERCQDVLHGRNRRTGKPEIPLSGGLLVCAHCGSAITGERIRRRLNGGGVREHLYYRCANNRPEPDHPRVRWRADELEQAIVNDLATLVLPSREIAAWFRTTLKAALDDISATQYRQRQALLKRQSELAAMKDRLLTAHLAGAVDAGTFQSKTTDLVGQLAEVERALASCGDNGHASGDNGHRCGDNGRSRAVMALAVFDWSQEAPAAWQRSKIAEKRAILDALSLNRTLSATTLCLEKRKPFDALAERPLIQLDRSDRI